MTAPVDVPCGDRRRQDVRVGDGPDRSVVGAPAKPRSTDGWVVTVRGLRLILIVGAVGMLWLLVCPAFPVGVSVGPFGRWIRLARIVAGCIRSCCATT